MESKRISDLLERVNAGDEQARQSLICVAYAELRAIAASFMRGHLHGHTLQPTALVNEAYLRLVQRRDQWDNKAHFFGAAARAMRQVLVAHARQKHAKKRFAVRVTLTDVPLPASDANVDVRLLDEAMTALAAVDDRLARVMELRYFAGCSLPEIARLTQRSLATVKRDWTYARAWLYEYMNR